MNSTRLGKNHLTLVSRKSRAEELPVIGMKNINSFNGLISFRGITNGASISDDCPL